VLERIENIFDSVCAVQQNAICRLYSLLTLSFGAVLFEIVISCLNKPQTGGHKGVPISGLTQFIEIKVLRRLWSNGDDVVVAWTKFCNFRLARSFAKSCDHMIFWGWLHQERWAEWKCMKEPRNALRICWEIPQITPVLTPLRTRDGDVKGRFWGYGSCYGED
jgi:hypothetical protein